MKRPSIYVKMKVLGAIDVVEGRTRHERMQNVAAPAGAFESGPTEVRFSRSTDGGVTWSPSVRVHDDLPGNGAWHWFGNMDVSPNGRIDVIWYDTRDTGLANESELYYAWSWDGGLTWLGNVVASPAFDTHLGWPQQAKIGDYSGIASDETGCRGR